MGDSGEQPPHASERTRNNLSGRARELTRVSRKTAQESVTYVLDDKYVLAEANAATGANYRRYHYGATQPVAVDDGNGFRFIGVDAQGSASDFMTLAGQVQRAAQYDAWGRLRNGTAPSATDAKLGYTGHQEDIETGLVYARARYYDPELGRFLSRDTYEGQLVDAPSLHRYAYTRGNPLRYRDPDGKWGEGLFDGIPLPFLSNENQLIRQNLTSEDREWFDRGHAAAYAQSVLDWAYTKYERGVDALHASANGLAEEAGFQYASLASHFKPTEVANAEGAVLSAGLEVGISVPFSVLDTATRPQRVVEGIAALPGEVREGSQIAANSSLDTDTRVRGAARALGAASQMTLIATGTAEALDEGLLLRPKGEPLCAGGRCAGRINCFVAGTLVTTQAGKKPIESVRLGDRVLSRDEQTGANVWERVVSLYVTPEQRVVDVKFVDSEGHEEDLGVTTGHPFWTMDHGWRPAATLEPGEALSSANGQTLWVKSVSDRTRQTATVYNFEVEQTHSYFVGTAAIWVHNVGECQVKENSAGAVEQKPAPETPHYQGDRAAPETSAPNSIWETKYPDGTRRVTYYNENGQSFTREDYGQKAKHIVEIEGARFNLKTTPHEHQLRVVDGPKGPYKKHQVRILTEHGSPASGWVNSRPE